MVRLRREIDGIALNHARPVPAHALDSDANQLILPTFDETVAALPAGRALLAGVPTVARAEALVRAGHHVTVADLERHELHAFNAALGPAASSKLTLVDKPYGEAAFGPSSFDAIVLMDTAHRYVQPRWIAQKAYRELKFDGHLCCRLWVHGPAPADTTPVSSTSSGLPPQLWQTLTSACKSPAAVLLLDRLGRDAIDRGAHLPTESFAAPWAQTLDELGDRLTLLNTIVGHTMRLRAAELFYGARPALRALLSAAIETVPELADDADLQRGGARAVGARWQKRLGGARLKR